MHEPQTAFEKIVGRSMVKKLPDGRMVLALDKVFCHEITTPPAIIDARARGLNVVFDLNRIKAMIDHVTPAKDSESATQGKVLRDWAREHGIEFLDVGRNGVCHAVIPEKGWILPGDIAIMGDSHTCTHGAFGALAAGVGTTDLQAGLITGLWILPPQKVIRVNYFGKLPKDVFSKDMILALLREIGADGAANAILEFGGEAVSALSMDARMTITNMAVEAGATSGMIGVDEETVRYLWPVLKDGYDDQEAALRKLSRLNSDPGCRYDRQIEIDVSSLEPLMAIGDSPANVVTVESMVGVKVDQVYVGSCTNGRLEDIDVFVTSLYSLADGIDPSVRCVVAPATAEVTKALVDGSNMSCLLASDCCVTNPTCGACLGMSNGVLAEGEVCLSTTNRNFSGRMGKGGKVFLASPAVAGATAAMGAISLPKLKAADRRRPNKEERTSCSPTSWKGGRGPRVDYASLKRKVMSDGGMKSFGGRVFYLSGADNQPMGHVNTDLIIPAKYLTLTDRKAFGKYCLEDAPIRSEDRPKLFQSRVLIAGEDFGCGSSREQAVWALEEAGITCVIALSFARIFKTNMLNNGLLCLTVSPEEMRDLWAMPLAAEDFLEMRVSTSSDQVRFYFADDFPELGFSRALTAYEWQLIISGGSLNVMLGLAAELQLENEKPF